jgi:hypothetical protein
MWKVRFEITRELRRSIYPFFPEPRDIVEPPWTATKSLGSLGIAHRLGAIPDKLLRMSIADADKDHLAVVVEERWLDFQSSLSGGGRRYPTREFETFVQSVRNYIAHTEKDPLLHRKVVNVIHGLPDSLKASKSQARFWPKRIGWSASCSPDMIRTSKVTSHRGYDSALIQRLEMTTLEHNAHTGTCTWMRDCSSAD